MKRRGLAILGCLPFVACGYAGEDLFERVEIEQLEGCDAPVDLNQVVLPAISTSCGVCHVQATLGNLNLADDSGTLTPESFVNALVEQPSTQVDKPLIESGHEAGSYFIDRILQRDASIMPPAGEALSDEAASALRCWVEQGATLEGE